MKTTKQWAFLSPWLDVLAKNMEIVPQTGWREGLNGVAPLAHRLGNLVISVETAARMKSYDDAMKDLACLRRAMEIVALALRVEPRVWSMLRGYLPPPGGEEFNGTLYPDSLARGDWFFRDEDVEVAFMMDTYWRGSKAKTNAHCGRREAWEPTMLNSHDCSLERETYDTDAVMRCYRWLMEGKREEDDDFRSRTSRSAYRRGLAKIQRLNTKRVDLQAPIPVSFTLYLVDSSNDNLVKDIEAVSTSSRGRFLVADFKLRVRRYDLLQPILLQRIRALPGVLIKSVGDIAPDTGSRSNLVSSDGDTDATLGPVPRGISFWLTNGWELSHAIEWFWSCPVKKLKLKSLQFDKRAIDKLLERCAGIQWSGGNGDVERLELEGRHYADKYFTPMVDPIQLAGEVWGRPNAKCRLNVASPSSYSRILQRLQEIDPLLNELTPTTEWDCIPCDDPTMVFLVLHPYRCVECIPTTDVVFVSRTEDEDSAGPRHEPPPWLGKVRSLKVKPHTNAGLDGLLRLRWLMTSLVSLELDLDLDLDVTLQASLPAILVSLPASLEYLRLDASFLGEHVLEALLLAYTRRGLRVRSLQLSNKEGFAAFGLVLEALADSTSAIARRLEELVIVDRWDFPLDVQLASQVKTMLEKNERLGYFRLHGSMPSMRGKWQAKVEHFHNTPIRNRTGALLPLGCKLAFLSVVERLAGPMDNWVTSRVFGFAHCNLTRVVQITDLQIRARTSR